MLADPSKLAEPEASPVKEIVLAVANLDAVDALPESVALIVEGNFKFTLAEPLTEVVTAVPVPSELTIPMLRAVPQLAVVTFVVPLNVVPLIVGDKYN